MAMLTASAFFRRGRLETAAGSHGHFGEGQAGTRWEEGCLSGECESLTPSLSDQHTAVSSMIPLGSLSVARLHHTGVKLYLKKINNNKCGCVGLSSGEQCGILPWVFTILAMTLSFLLNCDVPQIEQSASERIDGAGLPRLL